MAQNLHTTRSPSPTPTLGSIGSFTSVCCLTQWHAAAASHYAINRWIHFPLSSSRFNNNIPPSLHPDTPPSTNRPPLSSLFAAVSRPPKACKGNEASSYSIVSLFQCIRTAVCFSQWKGSDNSVHTR